MRCLSVVSSLDANELLSSMLILNGRCSYEIDRGFPAGHGCHTLKPWIQLTPRIAKISAGTRLKFHQLENRDTQQFILLSERSICYRKNHYDSGVEHYELMRIKIAAIALTLSKSYSCNTKTNTAWTSPVQTVHDQFTRAVILKEDDR